MAKAAGYRETQLFERRSRNLELILRRKMILDKQYTDRYSLYEMSALTISLAAASILLFGLTLSSAASAFLPVQDLEGRIHSLEQNDANQVRVFVFLGSECPVSRSSVPHLNRLSADCKESGAILFGIWTDSSVTRNEARTHFKEWNVAFPILADTAGQLVGIMRPTHVPEAFVFLPGNELIYRGAIDNTFITPGRRRPNAEHKYLQDAILAAVKGDKPLVAKTDAVGCDFESPTQREGGGEVTFTKDIAPIIFSRCTTCHREGQAAPFPLINYAQTAKRARQISRITARREMPPWIPDANHEPFIGERWLSDKELSLLEQWYKNGTPEGKAEDLPPLPEFAAGWQLGEPDLIVKMTEPFNIPADGPDIIRNFVIPLPVDKDKLVAAIEFHPGNRSVVHHAVLFLDDAGHGRRLDRESPGPGYSIFSGTGFIPSGALGGWSVGNTPRRLPEGTGRYLKKNSDLVLQVHYHPTGRAESDQSEIGIYFVDKPVEEALQKPFSLVSSFWLANYQIAIPAGESSYTRKASYTLPEDIRMVGVVPHMHLLGKNMKVTATLPDGTMRVLINVPEWNYNWQDEYYYQHPFPLPRGTRIDLEATFDNSDDNPSNPSSPPQPVSWGEGTLDEMLYCFFLFSADSTEKVIRTIFDSMAHDQKQPRTQTK